MNIKKGIIAGAMIAAIGMTTITGVYAQDNTVNGKAETAFYTEGNYQYTFKEFSKEFKDNISKADKKKAEELFNKATKLGEDASKFYDELYKLDLFENEVAEELSFKDFAKEFKKDVKPDVKKKAETLYNQVLKFEKEGKHEEADKAWDELFKLDLFEKMEVEEISFKDFAKDFKKDVKPEVKKKAETLYNKAVKLDKEGKYDDAVKVWDELYKLDLFDVESIVDCATGDAVEELSFKDFAETFKKDVKPEVKKKAEALYNKVVKLEKDGKYEEASKVWDELFKMDLFEDKGVELSIDGDEGYNAIDMNDFDDDFDDMAIETIKPLTFEEFSKGFKKGVKPEVLNKAKDLYNKAVKADEESQKAWDELYKMDIYKPMDFNEDFSKMDW